MMLAKSINNCGSSDKKHHQSNMGLTWQWPIFRTGLGSSHCGHLHTLEQSHRTPPMQDEGDGV